MDYVELFGQVEDAIRAVRARESGSSAVPWSGTKAHHRDWWVALADNHLAHEAVLDMLEAGYAPENMHELVLQWPHCSEQDVSRLAYTQSEEKGKADRQTVTSVAKYLKRHFPKAPDHVIRDTAAPYSLNGKFTIVKTMPEMLEIIRDSSVYSCMCLADQHHNHPYRAYCPQLGWGVAARLSEDTRLLGRALVYEHGGHKCFVRTYKGDENNRSDDPYLQAWLEKQGYEMIGGWPIGAKLRKVETSDGLLAPYLDGDNHSVNDTGSYLSIRSGSSGEIDFDSSNGLVERGCVCDDCGSYADEEDMFGVGDSSICRSCIESEYTCVRTTRWDEQYVKNDEAVWVDGTAYHADRLDYFEICYIENGSKAGDYAHNDDIIVDMDGETWHVNDEVDDPNTDDSGVCRLTAGREEGEYVSSDCAFTCPVDDQVYLLDEGVGTDEGYVAKDNYEVWKEQRDEDDEDGEDEQVAEEAAGVLPSGVSAAPGAFEFRSGSCFVSMQPETTYLGGSSGQPALRLEDRPAGEDVICSTP